MTATELRDLLVREIAKANGGGLTRWRKAIGEIKVYSRKTHAHCNWEVRPSGSVRDMAIIERAVDALRPQIPHVEVG